MIANRLRSGVLLVLVLLALAGIAVSGLRHSILQAGWALVVNERVRSADVIIVSGDADGAGVLEASDLVHNGVASRVAVFAYAPDAVEREFARRGIPYENKAARSVEN